MTQNTIKIKSPSGSFSQKNYDGDTSALIIEQNKVLVYVKGQSFVFKCLDDLTCQTLYYFFNVGSVLYGPAEGGRNVC